jgi:hypothetical protein
MRKRLSGTGWEIVHAARFLISNESFYVNAHTLFSTAAVSAAPCGASPRNRNGWRLAAALRSAQFITIRNFLEHQK